MSSDIVGEIKIALGTDNTQFDEGLKRAEKQVKSFGEIAYQTIAGEAAQKAFNAVLGAITGAINKMNDFATSTVEIGKAFDTSMSNVAAISGATAEELLNLRDKAKEMGAATKYTATEAADAMSYMAMAGWKTEDMLNGVAGVMNLAAAAGADLAAASDIVTDALTGFGEGADQAGRLADIMAAASSNANTNVEVMGETFKYVTPIAGALGYSMEDTALAIGLMANAGVKGTQAGTSLRSIMQRLATDTNSARTVLEGLGVEIMNSDGSMKELNAVIGNLRVVFQGLSEAEQVSIANTVAGTEAMSSFLAIVNSGDEDFEKLTNSIMNSAGAAEKMAFVMIDNLAGAQELVSSKAESLKLSLYDRVEPALTAITKSSGAMLEALMGADGGMDLLATAGDEIVKSAENMAETLPNLIQRMAERVPKIISTIMPALTKALPKIVETVVKIIPMITQAILRFLPELIKLGMQLIVSIIQGIAEMIPEIVQQIVDIIPEIVEALMSALPDLTNGVLQLLYAVLEAIPMIIPPLLDQLPPIISALVEGLISQIPTLLNGAIQLLMAIVDAIPKLIQILVPQIPNIVYAIIQTLIEHLPDLINGAVQLLMALVDAIPLIIPELILAIPQIIVAIAGALIEGLPKILLSAGKLLLGIVISIIGIVPKVVEAAGKIVEGIWEGIKNGAEWLWNQLLGFCNGIVDWIKDFFGIHSPSKLFEDEVGAMLAQGIGVGFTVEMEDVSADMTAAIPMPASDSMDAWSGAIDTIFTQDAPENITEENMTIVQNNNIYNDWDIEQVGEALLQQARRVA